MTTMERPLPPGHFLALPPSYAQPSHPSSSNTASHESNGLAPNVASLAAADYDVDVRTGFLPGSKNIERLPSSWDLWEDALVAARSCGLRIGGPREEDRLWRQGIEMMPVLDLPRTSLPLLRRAHLVLSFLLHFYAHTSPKNPADALSIPPSISIPLVTASDLLGLPPILTYSDTVLYNFAPADSTTDVSITNLPSRALETFTNTRSEEMFYVISAQCEIAGAEALRLMRQSLDELFIADTVALRRLAAYLRRLAVQIDLIGDITLSMMKEIDPEEFYHLIRPWFKGADSEGPESKGWRFEGIDTNLEGESGKSRSGSLFSGPSAGQSSLIHAIDIFLTVDHAPTESERTEADEKIILDDEPVGSSKPNEATFVQRMLQYMPLQHRHFLLHLAQHPTPLRQLVLARAESNPKLAEAYNGALEALRRFREKHMRIVSMFIVQQARRQPSDRIRRLVGMVEGDAVGEGEVLSDLPVGELRGTGGSPLFKFLKRCRDNTTRAMVGKLTAPGYELE